MRVDTTNYGWGEPGASSLLVEKIRSYVDSGHLRFLPYVEVDADETTEMRRNYRKMWREASIAAALDSMIFGTASLDLTVVPEDPAIEADRRNAKFLEHNLQKCSGGIRGIIQAILIPALIEGISVCELKFEPGDHPKWPGTKLYLKEVRALDPDDYELQEDGFRRIKAVVSRMLMRRYRPEHFLIYSYLPLFNSPRGQAILRRVTREFWIIDAAMKFHRIGLERWVLPWIKATGQASVRVELEKAIKALGAMGYVFTPDGATVEAMTLAMEGDKFESAIQLYQGRISLALTGATLAANEGIRSGSFAQANVHQGTVELGGWYRAASISDVVNEQLAPKIIRMNWADGGIPRMKLGGVNEEERQKRLQVFMGAAQIKRLSKKQINDELGLQEPLDEQDATQIVGAGAAAPPGAGGLPGPVPFADAGVLPAHRQSTTYTCGPTALQLALAYHGLPEATEQELADQMGTTPQGGTPPEAILRVARLRGLAATERHRMSLEDLDAATEAGQVVICPIQAHGTPAEERAIQAGHYVVVYRAEDGQISYLDPSVPGGESMESDEFEQRWVDREPDGDLYVRYGITLEPAEQLHCGGKGGKPGPCPKGKTDTPASEQPSGSHSPEAVTKARAGWLARAKEIPAKVLGAAKAKVQQKFEQLSNRYGKGYAYAIMGAGLAGIPLPIPGSSILTAAPVLAVAELHKQLGGPLGFADEPTGVGHLTPQEIDELGKAFVAGLMGDEPDHKLADDPPVPALPVERTKAGAAAADQTALAGPDGRAIAELLAATQRRGVQVLANLTEDAVTRLLRKGSPQRAQRLFTEAERQELAASLASTLGPGELLGRARIRLAQAQVLQEHASGLVTHCEDTPTSLVVFRDAENPLRPLAPDKAIEYFKSLVPTIGVDPATFIAATGQRAFTLAVATEQQILEQVKGVLLRTLETGDAGGIDAIKDLLDAAGVSHRNPFYAENVYRTNLKSALNEGYDAERQDPDVLDTFPCWLFSGIRDGRQRKNHEIRFGRYYPARVTFAEIRDSAAGQFDGFSCRCDAIAVNKYRWQRLQEQGARVETSW